MRSVGVVSRATGAAFLMGVAAGIFLGLKGVPPAGAQQCPQRTLYGDSNQNNFSDDPGRSTTWYGYGGADYAEMRDCPDYVYGGAGSDELHGAYGVDHVYGESGNDRPINCGDTRCGKLFGGADGDIVSGGGGSDDVDDSQAGSDSDVLYGDDANDSVNGKDGDYFDVIRGGAGTDTCYRDPGDDVAQCE